MATKEVINMYKVMLIDDEEIIVNGMKRIIKWDKFECQVVGEAHDALEGAQLIRELNPDILFTDICMNEVTGLEMLAGLRSEFPDLEVTVLSGYTDFSYTQDAMKLGVRRYLQKPSKVDEIIEALEFMVSKLKQLENSNDKNKEVEHKEVIEGNNFVLKNALEYMERNFESKITLSDVADQVYISQWHLSKLLNKHANQTFYDVLNTLRINKAKELLFNPQLRISDIATMVGYTDAAHFSKIFKKETGISAKQYRSTLLD